MSKSAGILRRTALVLFALIALAILLMVLSRLTTPSAQTRTALELMRMDELPEGENAFGLLWTLNRDVPDDEIDAVVRADVTKVAGWEENWGPREPIVEEQEWRRDAYPDLSPAPEDRALFCGTDAATPCLEHVQAAAEDVALAVERNAPLLDRIRRLRDTQVIRNAMPPKLMAP
ncbi:MAG: hypothetical protein V2J20_06900, partial [Wenzhouxiangella sp.]|nr:hypothetical protein [Wenzhouxiangella sp.]